MKIISGIYKNKPIIPPNNSFTHPMGSREKLALFNMLLPYLPSSIVLDAFAGTGSLGLECLSRGASRVVFVEKISRNAHIISENLKNLGPDAISRARVIIGPVEKAPLSQDYDIIIADPPYDQFDIKLIAPLEKYLKAGGVLALSHPNLDDTPTLPNLTLISSHHYAAAHISLYHRPE